MSGSRQTIVCLVAEASLIKVVIYVLESYLPINITILIDNDIFKLSKSGNYFLDFELCLSN